MALIGWDIGGAHLKAARWEEGRIVATTQVAAPLRLGLERLGAWTGTGRVEELRIGIAAELMAQHAKGSGGVAEGAGDLVGGAVFDEEGAKRFVLALAGMGGLGEESSDVC